MGMFKDICGRLDKTSSVLTLIVLAAADYLWGENVFSCPCGEYRVLYTVAFLVVPPIWIIIFDVSWSSLISIMRQNCCCESVDNNEGKQDNKGGQEDKQRQKDKGRPKCQCLCSKNCCSNFIQSVCLLLGKPVVIAIVWIILSCLEPRFGKCIYESEPCETEEQRKAAMLRVVTVMVVMAVTGIAVLGMFVYLFSCCPPSLCCSSSCSSSCCASCICQHRDRKREARNRIRKERELTNRLYTRGVSPGTVLRLMQEDLMAEEGLRGGLSDNVANRLIDRGIPLGQVETLRTPMEREQADLEAQVKTQSKTRGNTKAEIQTEAGHFGIQAESSVKTQAKIEHKAQVETQIKTQAEFQTETDATVECWANRAQQTPLKAQDDIECKAQIETQAEAQTNIQIDGSDEEKPASLRSRASSDIPSHHDEVPLLATEIK